MTPPLSADPPPAGAHEATCEAAPQQEPKVGRHSTFSQALADAICTRLANGETLSAICDSKGMPDFSTVWRWEESNEQFRKASARAREVGTHKLADECIAIADTPLPGVTEKFELVTIDNPDDPEGEAVKELQLTERKVEDMLGHRRFQVDTRMRLIGQWNRKVYGPKADVTHEVGPSILEQLVRQSGLSDGEKA